MTRWIVALSIVLVAGAGTLVAVRASAEDAGDAGAVTSTDAVASTGAVASPSTAPIAVSDTTPASLAPHHATWDVTTLDDARRAAVTSSMAAGDGFLPLEPVVSEPVRAFDAPAETLVAGIDYRVLLLTSAGTLEVDVFEDLAPATVDNFVFLALHRFYDGVPFHRVLDGFMAQTGDPTGTGSGGPGYRFDDEFAEGLTHDRGGLLSMANAGPDTNGSQFFLTFVPTPWLDGRHAIFGEVVAGREVLDQLTRIDPSTPSFVARVDQPLADLIAQGATFVPGVDTGDTVEAWLTERLGSVPDVGANFVIEGRNGVVGTIDGALAIGLFPTPDTLDAVIVMAAPKSASSQDADQDAEPDTEPDTEEER